MVERYCPHCMAPVEDERESYCRSCGKPLEAMGDPASLAVGTVLAADAAGTRTYYIGDLLGAGGFGRTYLARDLVRSMAVAVKEYFPNMLQPQRASDGRVVPPSRYSEAYAYGKGSFLEEAKMLAAVNHVPAVVHVSDYFETNGTAYMVMEYVNGDTLQRLVEGEAHLDVWELMELVLPLMDGLVEVHDTGLVHRDIAPDNVILSDGRLKLIDFGAARSMEDGRSMTVEVKPGFSPIEQYQRHGQGPYTDVHALCATVYYCLTGEVPIDAPTRLMGTSDGGQDPLVPPSVRGVEIPPEAEAMLMWGLRLQPKDRAQDMCEIAATFRQLLDTHKREEQDRRHAEEEKRRRIEEAKRQAEEARQAREQAERKKDREASTSGSGEKAGDGTKSKPGCLIRVVGFFVALIVSMFTSYCTSTLFNSGRSSTTRSSVILSAPEDVDLSHAQPICHVLNNPLGHGE